MRIILALSLVLSAHALTETDAEARLRMARQIARERNDHSLVSEVEKLAATFKSGLPKDAESQLREVEVKVGIDPGGWSMAGQSLFHPTSEMEQKSRELSPRLQAAMADDDATQVRAVVAEMTAALGDQAGVPDGRRMGRQPKGTTFSEAEATKLFLDVLKSEDRAMRSLMDGRLLPDQMVRLYSYVLSACADIRPFVAKHQPESLPQITQLAEGCAKILTTLQQSDGHFPFPDLRGRNIRFGDMITRQVEAGKVEVKDGWVITADPDGGTQFDTGVCGRSLLLAGEVFKNEAWIAAGKRAAEWALGQKCCGNFNYNAFSVSLLANAYRLSKDERYLEGAWRKFRIGVAPGQAANGRWVDAHNARTVYHVIILRALGDLTSVSKERREEIKVVSLPAIKALLDEFDAMGITVEALPELLTMWRLYPDDKRLKQAVATMAASLIEKSTDGRRVKMGAQPDQLAALARAMKTE
jgi:hypothetical protein